MGRGIAQVAASHGETVFLFDTNKCAIRDAREFHDKIFRRLVEKGRISETECASIKANITYIDNINRLVSCDLIIEAIIEDLEIKQHLFHELEELTSIDTILATNTSSLSVAACASVLKYPERCIGMHFFNPAPLMKLVEVVPAVQTSDATVAKVMAIAESWEKQAVLAKDTPGFIVNRVARPFYGEALRILEEGVADAPTIDACMKTIGGFRMGPFELMDFIGNDINLKVTETVFKAFFYDPRYRPSFTQMRMVEAGYLGKKSGKGFYDYSVALPEPQIDTQAGEQIFNRVLAMLINEAADAVFLKIASHEAIDQAMTMGVNYPKGLLRWADEKGMDWCVQTIDDLYNTYHEDRYRCSPLLRKMLENNETFYNE